MRETLGKVIRRVRIQKGMSQRGLAAKAGISNSTISRIEAEEEYKPWGQSLKKIAAALDLDEQKLTTLTYEFPPEDVNVMELEPEVLEIRNAALSMSVSDRQKMLALVKAAFPDHFKAN